MNTMKNHKETEISRVFAEYLEKDMKGAPKPDLVEIIKQIRLDNPKIGANGAMQRAVDVIRYWGLANGYCA